MAGITELRASLTREIPSAYASLIGSKPFVDAETTYTDFLFDAVHNSSPLASDSTPETISRVAHLLGHDPEEALAKERERMAREGPHRQRSDVKVPWAEEYLGGFGKRLREIVARRDFIDLGDGGSPYAPRMARYFGARCYIGVDNVRQEDMEMDVEGLECLYIKDDMLRFLASTPSLEGVVFLLSGLEPGNSALQPVDEYIDALGQEMGRLTRPGDSVILGPLTFRFPDSQTYGFVQEWAKNDNALYVKR